MSSARDKSKKITVTGCDNCPFAYDTIHCQAMSLYGHRDFFLGEPEDLSHHTKDGGRPDWCPLPVVVEVGESPTMKTADDE